MARIRELDDPRRRVLIRALSLGLLSGGFASTGSVAQTLFGSRPAKLPPGQSVFRITGKVTVNGQEATLKTQIKPGDTIQTAKGSELVFVIGANSMILRDESTLTIVAQPDDVSLVVRGLQLLKGALLSVSRGTAISLSTTTANVGIRGTGFYVESEPEQTYFCTCYGVTDVAAAADPESRETIAATHHDRPVYIVKDGGRGKAIRNAPFINHTDQELALIETLVGRTPPFIFPKDSYSGPRRDY